MKNLNMNYFSVWLIKTCIQKCTICLTITVYQELFTKENFRNMWIVSVHEITSTNKILVIQLCIIKPDVHRLQHTWLLRIASVRECLYACVRPLGY